MRRRGAGGKARHARSTGSGQGWIADVLGEGFEALLTFLFSWGRL